MPASTRITHIIVRLGTGGAEKSLFRLLRQTQGELQHQVICFGRATRLGRDIEALGVSVHWLDERRLGPLVLSRALSLLRREPPDILQGWMYYGNLLASWLGKRLPASTHTVWNIRSAPADLSAEKWQTRWAIRRGGAASLAPEFIIYNSHAGQRVHEPFGYNRHPHTVIGNGIDLAEFAPDARFREQVRLAHGIGDAPWVAMLCRYHPSKGVDVFLAAVRAMVDAGCRARFALAGPGMSADNAQLAGQLRLQGLADGVDLLGEIEAAPEFLPGLDILVQASWREGTPNVLIEAMACGVLTVATRVGDTEHILPDSSRLVEAGDAAALAEAIHGALELLGNSDAAATAARVQSERNRLSAEYDMHRCVQAYRDTYAQLIGTCV